MADTSIKDTENKNAVHENTPDKGVMPKKIKKVMAAVFAEQGKILIMRRAPCESWAGWWEFPGGKLENGETHEEGLARELMEELHVKAQIGELLAENRHDYGSVTVHLFVYRVAAWEGSMTLTVHDAMHWEAAETLEFFPYLLPADIPVARVLAEKRKNQEI